MAEERVQRRLAAILAADVVGYSRLMGADEAGTLARLKTLRGELLDPKAAEYGGRIFKTTGDGILIEFPSAVDAVQYALDVQREMARRNADLPEERRIELRIGINVGEVIVDGEDLFGDGVNVAARLEALAEPGGVCISADAHRQVRGRIEAGFADLGARTLKNIAEPVQVWRVTPNADIGPAASASWAVLQRPAVAVLPFENLSGDPEQEFFADGLTEDIITALSLWRSFPVIARNSTYAYKGRSPDIRAVGAELGARYVIEGSVRKAGGRVRVTAQLIDGETGHHVWAERFDRQIDYIFELQDEIAARIAATVAPEVERAEAIRSTSKPQSMDAWDFVHRGFAHLNEFTIEGNAKARAMFERAIALDPTYARAYCGLAYSYHRDVFLDPVNDREENEAKLLAIARRAVELDETDSFAQMELGIAYQVALSQQEQALPLFNRAIALNPSNWIAYTGIGMALTLLGRAEEGISNFEKAFRLNPQDPRNVIYYGFMARAHFSARSYEEATRWAREAIQRRPAIPDPHLILAASLGQLGRIDEARAELETCERLQPGYTRPENWLHKYETPADHDHFLDGLRKAGFEG